MNRFRSIVLISLVAALPLFAQESAPEAFGVDKAHSVVGFRVRHMMSKVSGNFRDVDAAIHLDRANPAKSSVEFTIQAKSIDTGNANRDEHLRSADFFDVEKFPTITFKSKSVKAKSKDEFDVTGDLTMHGVTKEVTLPVSFLGFAKTSRGELAGFEIETTLNRKDYGIVWNRALDEGGVVLGDDVNVTINIEARKKQAPPAEAK
jgi:polyisoprenoid-binding protein YceI